MSMLYKPAVEAKPRSETSSTSHRSILDTNGIRVDPTGRKIPPSLRAFLISSIIVTQPTPFSEEIIEQAKAAAIMASRGPEAAVRGLLKTATHPAARKHLTTSGGTVWPRECLPEGPRISPRLDRPKPDVHVGYNVKGQSWTKAEMAVLLNPNSNIILQPAHTILPFLILEFVADDSDATLWRQAENVAATAGSCAVAAFRWLYREAWPCTERVPEASTVFSACVSHRRVVFHVHWYDTSEHRHYVSWMAEYDMLRQVSDYNHTILNILDHGMLDRLHDIKDALAYLSPTAMHREVTLSFGDKIKSTDAHWTESFASDDSGEILPIEMTF